MVGLKHDKILCPSYSGLRLQIMDRIVGPGMNAGQSAADADGSQNPALRPRRKLSHDITESGVHIRLVEGYPGVAQVLQAGHHSAGKAFESGAGRDMQKSALLL